MRISRGPHTFQGHPAPSNTSRLPAVVPVLRLIKVYKHHVQFLLHYPVFIYHLTRFKYGISCPSVRNETELLVSYAQLVIISSLIRNTLVWFDCKYLRTGINKRNRVYVTHHEDVKENH